MHLSLVSCASVLLAALITIPNDRVHHADDDRVPPPSTATTAAFADFRDLAGRAGLNAPTRIGGERTKHYILETTGGGVAVLDYDNDEWLDIFVVNGARVDDDAAATDAPISHLYKNNRDGTFVDVTAKAGVGGRGWGQAVCAGDYDNDGDLDLFVTYYGHVVLYRNNADGTFTDITARSGLSGAARWNTGAAFLDFDRDGRLDVFVSAYVAHDDAARHAPGSGPHCFWKGRPVMCGPKGLAGSHNALYRGHGDGTFANVSEQTGVLKTAPAFGFTPLVLDYDNDRWPDIYVANDSTASFLFHNNADGTFTDVGLTAGVALTSDGRAQAGMGVGAADYDRDGWLDLVKTNFDDDTTSLYRNLSGEAFDDATFASGLGVNTRFLGWGTGFFDVDLDGWPDLFTVNGHVYPEAAGLGDAHSYKQSKVVYRNLGHGRFADVSARAGAAIQQKKASRGAALGDLFKTGRLSLVVNNMHDVPSLLYDCGPAPPGHSLVIQLVGTRSNRSGIGARVIVHAGTSRLVDEVRSGGSFCSQHDLRIHVGLGAPRAADRVEVLWPSGARDLIEGVDAGQTVVIREGAGIVRREAFSKPRPAWCAAR